MSDNNDTSNFEFNLRNLLSAFKQSMDSYARQHEVDFTIQLDPGIEFFLMGDPAKISQVLIHLTSLGIRYTKSKKLVLSVKLGERQQDSDQLNFSLEEIPPGQLDHLEEQSAADVSSELLQNTQNLIESFGGSLSVQTTESGSSVFTFSIQIKHANDEEPAPEFNEDFPGFTLLVVDHEEVNRYVAETLISRLNASFVSSSSISEAIETVAVGNVDLILLNQVLVQGEQPASIRRQFPMDKPVFVMLSNGDKSLANDLEIAGFDGVLTTPFDPQELLDLVVRYWSVQEGFQQYRNENRRFSFGKILRMYRGNRSFVRSTGETFIKELGHELENMTELLETGNIAAIPRIAHKIYPNIVLFQITELKGILRDIEYADHEREPSQLRQRTSHFIRECGEIVDEIRSAITEL